MPATDVLRTPSNANQLEPAITAAPESVGKVEAVLADGGYVNATAIEGVEKRGIEAYVAISDEEQNVRRYDYRPPRERKRKVVEDPRLIAMREKLRTEEGGADLRQAGPHGRACVRDHQGAAMIPTVSAARPGQGAH